MTRRQSSGFDTLPWCTVAFASPAKSFSNASRNSSARTFLPL